MDKGKVLLRQKGSQVGRTKDEKRGDKYIKKKKKPGREPKYDK